LTNFLNSKQTQESLENNFPENEFQETNIALDLVHIDVWGPAPLLSNFGARDYECFLDDCTKFMCLFPLKLKSDIENVFLHFNTYIKHQFNYKIKNIQSN
jgi:histone deacetylase 1/2